MAQLETCVDDIGESISSSTRLLRLHKKHHRDDVEGEEKIRTDLAAQAILLNNEKTLLRDMQAN